MRKSVLILAALIVFVVAGGAANAQDQSKQALAEELLKLLNVKETQEKVLAMYEQMISTQLQRMNSQSKDPAVQAKVADLMKKILAMVKQATTWDKLKKDYIDLYAQTYTESELKDIIAFYKTPSGQTYVKKQPEVLKRSFQLSQKMMGGLMPKIQAMVTEFRESTSPKPASKPASKPAGK